MEVYKSKCERVVRRLTDVRPQGGRRGRRRGGGVGREEWRDVEGTECRDGGGNNTFFWPGAKEAESERKRERSSFVIILLPSSFRR